MEVQYRVFDEAKGTWKPAQNVVVSLVMENGYVPFLTVRGSSGSRRQSPLVPNMMPITHSILILFLTHL